MIISEWLRRIVSNKAKVEDRVHHQPPGTQQIHAHVFLCTWLSVVKRESEVAQDIICNIMDTLWRSLLQSISCVLAQAQGDALVAALLKAYQQFSYSAGLYMCVHVFGYVGVGDMMCRG